MRELDALLRRLVRAERMAHARFGQVCAVVANVNRGKDKPPYKASDFFDLGGLEAPLEPISGPEADKLDYALAWAAGAGAEIIVREQDA